MGRSLTCLQNAKELESKHVVVYRNDFSLDGDRQNLLSTQSKKIPLYWFPVSPGKATKMRNYINEHYKELGVRASLIGDEDQVIVLFASRYYRQKKKDADGQDTCKAAHEEAGRSFASHLKLSTQMMDSHDKNPLPGIIFPARYETSVFGSLPVGQTSGAMDVDAAVDGKDEKQPPQSAPYGSFWRQFSHDHSSGSAPMGSDSADGGYPPALFGSVDRDLDVKMERRNETKSTQKRRSAIPLVPDSPFAIKVKRELAQDPFPETVIVNFIEQVLPLLKLLGQKDIGECTTRAFALLNMCRNAVIAKQKTDIIEVKSTGTWKREDVSMVPFITENGERRDVKQINRYATDLPTSKHDPVNWLPQEFKTDAEGRIVVDEPLAYQLKYRSAVRHSEVNDILLEKARALGGRAFALVDLCHINEFVNTDGHVICAYADAEANVVIFFEPELLYEGELPYCFNLKEKYHFPDDGSRAIGRDSRGDVFLTIWSVPPLIKIINLPKPAPSFSFGAGGS